MPDPKKDEKKEDYMKRCIPILVKEGKSVSQAVAVCSSMFDNRKTK